MSESHPCEVSQVSAEEDDVVTCAGCGEVIWSPNCERPGCEHTVLLTHAEGDEPFRCAPELFARAVELAGPEAPEDAADLLAELKAEGGWDAPADWIMDHEEVLSRALDELYAGARLVEVQVSGRDEHTLWQLAPVTVVEGDDVEAIDEAGPTSDLDEEA